MLPKWMILKKCVDNVLVFRFRQLNFMTRVSHLEETWEFILQKNLLGYWGIICKVQTVCARE